MKLTVHDVGHGLCISLIHENGNIMLWDCGHSDVNRPSQFLPALGVQKINNFFITNYDEDHISDLPNLHKVMGIETIFRNRSISADQLQELKLQKSDEISPAMNHMLDMIKTYNGSVTYHPAFPEVDYRVFYNHYGDDFKDTNNISLVTFLKCRGICFIIPGDLEESGWKLLLQRDDFRNELKNVNVFIASHHGRENGYCREVFDHCTPDVVVFSDSEIQHTTQEMAYIYAGRSKGRIFKGQKRYVLSTRKDGSIPWQL